MNPYTDRTDYLNDLVVNNRYVIELATILGKEHDFDTLTHLPMEV